MTEFTTGHSDERSPGHLLLDLLFAVPASRGFGVQPSQCLKKPGAKLLVFDFQCLEVHLQQHEP